jgi:hypothetical protein
MKTATEFGNAIGWGKSNATGYQDSLARIYTITPEDVARWIREGITQEMAMQWIRRYTWNALFLDNPTAAGRAVLMAVVYDLLGGWKPSWWK